MYDGDGPPRRPPPRPPRYDEVEKVDDHHDPSPPRYPPSQWDEGAHPPPPQAPRYDEVEVVDDHYDPSPPHYPQSQWDEGAPLPPTSNPYPPSREEPRYSFRPPPPPAPYPYYPPPYPYAYGYRPDPNRNKNMAIAGGILCIISGSIGLVFMLWVWEIGGEFWVGTEFWWCVALQGVLSSIAIIGGIFAIRRRMFGLAILGAVCALLSSGFLMGLGTILAILAIVLIAIAKDSFDQPGASPQQQYFN